MATDVLRMARASDAAQLAAIYWPYVTQTPISFETEPPDAAEMAQRMAGILPTHPWLVLQTGCRLAGYAYASEHHHRAAYRWSVDVSIYLDRTAVRRGYGRRLYRALLSLLQMQGYISSFAGISLPNAASVGFHEAMGFTPLGVYRNVGYKDGQWYDVGWWQRPLVDRRQIPAEPVPWPALPDDRVSTLLAGG